MAFYTDGVVPWNSLDDNTRGPLASEFESGYPCGEADQELFNWTAGWPIGNIWNMILQGGITPDGDKLLDLARAIQNGKVNYAVTGGTANALTATLSPVPAALIDGLVLRLKVSTANTGAATLNVNGLGALPITTMRGGALTRGDLPVGAVVQVVKSGSAFLLTGLAYSEVPVIGDRTIYVRTDGNDANDGSANTAGSALATISAALTIARRAASTSLVTIQLGNVGTYAAPGRIGTMAAAIEIVGDEANHTAYTISGNGFAGSALIHADKSDVTVRGVRTDNLANICASLAASGAGSLNLRKCRFATSVAIGFSHVWAASGGFVSIDAGCEHWGAAAQALLATAGNIIISGAQIANAVPFSDAFAVASNGGTIQASTAPSYTGSPTGVRYKALLNGVINSGGAGVNFFPGSTAGTTATGGQYA